MKLSWNFQRDWGGGGLRKNPFHGGGVDIFWNYTMYNKTIIEFGFCMICNGNRTEWSPIQSVIIWAITKSDPICLSQVWLQTELDDTKSYYQLIIKITISEKK